MSSILSNQIQVALEAAFISDAAIMRAVGATPDAVYSKISIAIGDAVTQYVLSQLLPIETRLAQLDARVSLLETRISSLSQ